MGRDDAGRPVAWVTGGNRGMGADTAVALTRAGYDVAITARDAQRLEAVAEEIRAAGGRAFAQPSDLTDRASVEAFADAALDALGRCDVVVNIAIYKGPGLYQLLMDTDLEEMTTNFEADVIAPMVLVRRAIPSMLEHGGGTIVNMSSASIYREPSGTCLTSGWSYSYVAAKAGIDQMGKIVNVELGSEGIRAFTVEPGFVAYGDVLEEWIERYGNYPISPPESIGPAIVWLVTDPAATRYLAERVNLPALTHELELLEGWGGPGTPFASARD